MESLFLLAQEDRTNFLQHLLHSCGSSYICLWSYLPPPSNCLLFLDGVFKEEEGVDTRLFTAYCESVNYIDHGRVPGFAFKNNLPCLEMKLHDLQRLASSQMQMQFYQEAGIKTVVFMGCAAGEIELGLSTELQVDLETELKRWFPLDNFYRSSQTTTLTPPVDPITPNNSSRSSLSVDSIEYSSSSLFTLNTEAPNINLSTNSSPHDQSPHALNQIGSTQFPATESEDDIMARAILAVLSSPSSTSQQSLPPMNIRPSSHRSAAFTRYSNNSRNRNPALAPVAARKNNMFRRSVMFFRNLNMRRRQEMQIHGNYPPNPTQLHHMISERKRREKLNESFQVLRSLLPPGSKKDKASVLSSTTEYLSSLKSQVEDISRRNELLAKQLSKTSDHHQTEQDLGGLNQAEASTSSSSRNDHQRVNVEIEHVAAASTSQARLLDLRVNLRSAECSLQDLVIRILELVKQQRVVSLLSLQSSTTMVGSNPVHCVVLRFKVEGDEFEESSFQEAVRRVVDDQKTLTL